jgi:hypothetical protein
MHPQPAAPTTRKEKGTPRAWFRDQAKIVISKAEMSTTSISALTVALAIVNPFLDA